jgi:hypothetical protein
MSLPMERWSITVTDRTKQIDALLEAKLAPFAGARSERVRFLYDLGFKIFCADVTVATLQAVVEAIQRLSGITSAQPVIESPKHLPAKIEGFLGREKASIGSSLPALPSWSKNWAGDGRPTWTQ